MDTLHGIINNINLVLNIMGALIIIWGVCIALFEFIKNETGDRSKTTQLNETMRIRLGGYLVLALEFFIAGDIIKTIITPTWESLGILGAIIVIRTVLSYFLTIDLKKI
ncbi:MAG: DUF1622 domain-containing protein [Candidatus Omnitrophica bacterium]|nr:DUF1622 domain-containing protein [Candidatus Omnitrophota bacterium]MDD5661413.1 DUF1622 domain-containing protein [Candidatus Omnitrophota bacterium]